LDRRPALPIAVDSDTTRIRVDSLGRRHAEYDMTYTEYDWGRIKEGYCCFECGEAQFENGLPVAFLERCICGYPMRERQARDCSEQFDGPTTIGPTRSIEELRVEDEEQKERARRIREKPTSRIIVPNWVRSA